MGRQERGVGHTGEYKVPAEVSLVRRKGWLCGLRVIASGVVALGLLGSTAQNVGFAQSQPKTPIPKDDKGVYRFAGVEKWRGTFSWTGGGAGDEYVSNGHLQWNANHTASGTFELTGPTFPEPWHNVAVWEGPAVGIASINDEITITKGCERYEKWTASGAMPGVLGPGDGLKPGPLRAKFSVDFDEGTYQMVVSPETVDTHSAWRYTCNNSVSEGDDDYTTQLGAGGFTVGHATDRLPREGLNIDGHVTFDSRVPQMWDISEEGGIAEWTYQWGLQPAGENDVELVVDPQGFDTWLPEGGTATRTGGISVSSNGVVAAMASTSSPNATGAEIELSGGNNLTITAKLQDPNGGEPKQKARKITWELLDASREPGIAMNAPNVKMADTPDMQFDEYANVALAVRVLPGNEGRKAETTKPDLTEAQAVLRSNDWGAWGTLKVTAELESGQLVVGYLKGDKEQKDIRLPKRTPDSKVADYWKQQIGAAGRADNDDMEEAPEGFSGCPGDGLTLYEEYRGFFENGTHLRTNPTRKDYFVADRIGTRYSKAGISMFKGATQLETHGEMLVTDFDDNMVVNFNHAQGAHLVDQHGIQMMTRSLGGDMGAAAITRPGMLGPGTPRVYAWVVINSGLNPRASEYESWRYSSIVAHELAHTVSVHEHGAGDKQVQWIAWEDDDGVTRVHETVSRGQGSEDPPVAIVVKREDGTEIPATHPMFNGEGGLQLILGVRRGQHSGVQACLMRYDNSWAYASTKSGERNVRYLTQGDEQRGSMLCRTSIGTGVNDPSHDPQSRYGPAGPNRGDCVHQICVNDLASPPRR